MDRGDVQGPAMSLQLGSHGPLVAAWQRTMLTRFRGYAVAADGGALKVDAYYGYDDRDVQREYERRTFQPQDGIVSDADLNALGLSRPTLFTVCGTGVPWWVGPDADIARAVEDRWKWQPCGYPAAPFPMWPSITAGREELVRLALLPEFAHGDIAMIGYSQGAVIVSQVWKYDILPANGRLNHRLNDLKKVVTLGNPCRELGKARFDGISLPRADTAGILEDRLVDTPTWWREYAHAGDLYTDCEMTDEGQHKRAIGKIIMGNNWWTGPDSIIRQVIETMMFPIPETIAAVKAIYDAGLFFARGTTPHTNYRIQPAIDYLR